MEATRDLVLPRRGDGPALQRGLVLADQYRLLSVLAEGGLGRVWAAYDIKLQRKVAIKIPRPSPSDSLAPAFLIGREARLLARIDHPSVVKVLEFGRVGRRPFLVTEFLDGISLDDALEALRRRGAAGRWRHLATRELMEMCPKSSEPDCIRLASYDTTMALMFRGIVDAIVAAHEARVLHRDIRTSNVVLEKTGRPVLVDFGLGTSMGADPEPLSGCLRYLAPEQVRAQTLGADPRSDLYQLGLLFSAMLCTREPFEGLTAAETLCRLRGPGAPTPREIDERIPLDLDRICARAAAPELADRYRSAREIRDDLDAYLARM